MFTLKIVMCQVEAFEPYNKVLSALKENGVQRRETSPMLAMWHDLLKKWGIEET